MLVEYEKEQDNGPALPDYVSEKYEEGVWNKAVALVLDNGQRLLQGSFIAVSNN